MKLRQNELTKESSPYLLQHAKNPVAWQAWSEDVFEMAERENKLVLVSVGYSACHWCHVMEHECFEDEEVAEIMNAHFINVKVDREERPDVDHVYMTAVQLMTDRGGWPLNCFTLPNGQPVYGGTYFPKDQWIHILKSLVYTYDKDPQKIIDYAKNLTEGIQQNELINEAAKVEDFPFSKMEEMIQRWSKKFDSSEGGPTHAPKFPLPNNYLFLLRYGQLKKNETVNNHVLLTLHKMGFGGIYDQLKGGFARYSVDMLWKVPHFEKMLYDNGQLLQLYAEGYAVTQDPHFYRLMDQTVNWLETEMLSPEGGLYAAIDADSEGEEGKFYCWTKKELTQLLDANEQWFLEYYNINQKGYWEEEKYILLRSQSDASFVKKMNFSKEEFAEKLEKVHSKLLASRDKRIRPGTDNKQLCSWNALALSGLIRVSEVSDHLGAKVLAQKVLRFLNRLKRADGGLYRNYNQGQANIDGFLDDYASLIQAYLDDYQSHLNEDSLTEALRLTEYVNEHFSHPTSGMYYFTEKSSTLISRKMEINDNVLPSSNSIMAKNLYRLGILSSNTEYTKRSKQMLANIADGMEMYGSGYSNWADLYLNFSATIHEVCIIGPKAKEWAKSLKSQYLPNVLVFGSSQEDSTLFPYKGQKGKTLIYHCMNETCDAPVESLEEVIRKLLR